MAKRETNAKPLAGTSKFPEECPTYTKSCYGSPVGTGCMRIRKTDGRKAKTEGQDANRRTNAKGPKSGRERNEKNGESIPSERDRNQERERRRKGARSQSSQRRDKRSEKLRQRRGRRRANNAEASNNNAANGRWGGPTGRGAYCPGAPAPLT